MSSYLKKIMSESKYTLILFGIVLVLSYFIRPISISNPKEVQVYEYMNTSFIMFSITIVILQLIKFSYFINDSYEKFKFQGTGKRILKFITPLLGEFLAFIIIDAVVIILYYRFSINKTQESGDYSIFFADPSLRFLLNKYLIATFVFFLYNISRGIKELVVAIIIGIAALYIEIDSLNIYLSVILIIILLLLSYALYVYRIKKHNFDFLKKINYSFLAIMLMTVFYTYFISHIYLSNNTVINIGDVSINYLNFSLLIIFVIYFSYKNDKKIFSIINIMLLVIVPTVISSGLFWTQEIISIENQRNKLNYYGSDSEDNFLYIKTGKVNEVNTSNLINEEKNELYLLIKELKKKSLYKLKVADESKINSKYLKINKLLYIRCKNIKGELDRFIIKATDFDNVLKKNNYKKDNLTIFTDSKGQNEVYIVGDNSKLKKSNFKDFYDIAGRMGNVKFIKSTVLINKLEKTDSVLVDEIPLESIEKANVYVNNNGKVFGVIIEEYKNIKKKDGDLIFKDISNQSKE